MTLIINGETLSDVDPVQQIEAALSAPTEFLEVWLTHPDQNTLSALINHTHAFLVWMTPECPEGWHSRSPKHPAAAPDYLRFRLSNGQLDEFPEDICIARTDVASAFRGFWTTGARPATIDWMYC